MYMYRNTSSVQTYRKSDIEDKKKKRKKEKPKIQLKISITVIKKR